MTEPTAQPVPDPARATDLADLVMDLDRLRLLAGGPSYRTLAKLAGPLLRPPQRLAHTTIADLFQPRRRRLDVDLVAATVRALGYDDETATAWRRACIRVQSQARDPDAAVVARQVPRALESFTGRAAELDEIMAAALRGGPGLTLCVIEGMAGVGKTRIALQAVHALVRDGRYTGLQLYANLRGFTPDRPPADPSAVLDGFLRQLGVAPQHIPETRDERAAMFRDRMHGREAVVVLDNAADEAQLQDLIPAADGCLVLVTSRRALAGLASTVTVAVDVLAPAEALELLGRIAGGERVAAESEAARRITELCGRLPLALSLVAARLRARPAAKLSALVKQLESGLDVLRADGTDIRAVFASSRAGLSADARRAFDLLAIHPAPEHTTWTVAALADLTRREAERVVDQLIDEHLLEERSYGRYELHDLLRQYASECSDALPEPRRQEAFGRLVDHYLHTSHDAARVQVPTRDEILLPLPEPATRAGRRTVADAAEANEWFEAELTALGGLVETTTAPEPEAAWQLAWSLMGHGMKTSRYRLVIDTQSRALIAAESLGHARARGWSLLARAMAMRQPRDLRPGELENVEADLRDAALVLRGTGDVRLEGRCLCELANLYANREEFGLAIEQAEQAVVLGRAPEAGDDVILAQALNLLGWSRAHVAEDDSELEAAVDACSEAAELMAAQQNAWGLVSVLDSLAYAYTRLGRHDEAVATQERALVAHDSFDAPVYRGRTYLFLGDAQLAAGRPDLARSAWEQALAIFEQTGHPQKADATGRLARLDGGDGSDSAAVRQP